MHLEGIGTGRVADGISSSPFWMRADDQHAKMHRRVTQCCYAVRSTLVQYGADASVMVARRRARTRVFLAQADPFTRAFTLVETRTAGATKSMSSQRPLHSFPSLGGA